MGAGTLLHTEADTLVAGLELKEEVEEGIPVEAEEHLDMASSGNIRVVANTKQTAG